MQAMKSAFGLLRAVVPVLYCGGLLYYFLGFGSMQDLMADGLGPTVLGLGAVGLLFCIPLILKVLRILRGSASPGSGKGPGAPTDEDENGFDADAAIARYMAWRSTEAAAGFPAAPAAPEGGKAALRPTFGRKTR